jgi:hypothetical protein
MRAVKKDLGVLLPTVSVFLDVVRRRSRFCHRPLTVRVQRSSSCGPSLRYRCR